MEGEKSARVRHAAIANNDLGLPVEDWSDQMLHVFGVVLVIGVGVDDNVGSPADAGLQPAGEAGCQPAVRIQPHDMMDAVLGGHLRGAVIASVVDHQVFDLVDAR